jgi:hypothetical protein
MIISVPGWTRAHGFFLIMGGFQLFESSDQPSPDASEQNDYFERGVGRFIRILEFKDVLQHKLETVIPFTTEKEIKDRGKSDGISKFIVLLQTSWFIIQCIARGIKHLPLTELEIVTLAYAMMNLFVYIFWWDKPRDVGCPIRVYGSLTANSAASYWHEGVAGILGRIVAYTLGIQDEFMVLSQEQKVPMFWSGGVVDGSRNLVSFRAGLGPSILGIAFGAIHCIAWSYAFPSHAEFVVWRISCIAMMTVPLVTAVAFFAATVGRNSSLIVGVIYICSILFVASGWLYIASRLATIVMAFTTLRSLPSEAFTVIDWTTFIPHI